MNSLDLRTQLAGALGASLLCAAANAATGAPEADISPPQC